MTQEAHTTTDQPLEDAGRRAPGAGGRAPAVIAVHGEIDARTADWLESLGRRMILAGAPVVAIDLAAAPGVSGHLLGALRALVAAARGAGADLGVVASSSTAGTIRGHTPALFTAATTPGLLRALGYAGDPRRIALVRSSAEAAGEPRELRWAPPLVPALGRAG